MGTISAPRATRNWSKGYDGPVRAPRGTECKAASWALEAPRRMLLNNLDPEVAEAPDQLVVYGGTGRAARSWDAVRAIVGTLESMKPDETLLVQSGKPVGVFRTFEDAPRVLIANSHLVPKWATRDEHARMEAEGLSMYGQMTAGSWIYIGSQGIVQGTYETFAACGRTHFNGALDGELVVSGGLGGMGGAQPLAATMAAATFLGADVDGARIDKRLETGYIDKRIDDIDAAIDAAVEAAEKCEAISIGVCCNIVDLLERMVARDVKPSILTDQTSAHDPLNGYVPTGLTLDEAAALRENDPKGYEARSFATMKRHIELMLELQSRGAVTFDYGNNLRGHATEGGAENAFDIEGFVPAYIRPLFCLGKGPFRWVALSGDPEDIYRTDDLVLELFGDDIYLDQWIRMARRAHPLPGTAGAHLLARIRRAGEIRAGHERARREGRDQGANRDRPRSPRLRVGRQPLPRDRGDAGRLGRHRGLAAPQRHGQRRPAGPPGSRSITAAGSASATRSTRAR